jgi:PST family polysaccharide transporter
VVAKRSNKLFENFLAMLILQVSNYVFPFLTIPYLSRVLSTSHYGVVLFALSITSYLGVICDYGFALTATRDASKHRDDRNQMGLLLSSVTIIKFILFIVMFIGASAYILLDKYYRQDYIVYLATFFGVIYNVFFPVWLFQGLEKMRYITVVNVGMRLISVVLIFSCVRHDNDYVLIPVLNLVPVFVGIVYIQYVLHKQLIIHYILPTTAQVLAQLRQGWHVFLSTMISAFYSTSNSFMLGIFTHNVTYVAYYANAEKVITAMNSVYGAFFSALFPHAVKLLTNNRQDGVRYIKNKIWQTTIISLVISLIIFIFAKMLVLLLLGDKYLPSVNVLRILVFVPVIICISNLLVIQTIIPLGYERILPKLYAGSSLLYVVLTYFLIPKYTYVGMAVSVLIVELVVISVAFWYLKFRKVF